MSRRSLAFYIWCMAAYEIGIAAWFQLREGGAPPLPLDPRGSLEWMFASTLAPHSFVLSLASAAWLVAIGVGVMAAPRLLWIYGIVEACLALPTLIILGTVL